VTASIKKPYRAKRRSNRSLFRQHYALAAAPLTQRSRALDVGMGRRAQGHERLTRFQIKRPPVADTDIREFSQFPEVDHLLTALRLTTGMLRVLVIITKKLHLAVTVGRLITHSICDCWIVGDISKPKARLGFPCEESWVKHKPPPTEL